jgi:hypothetical protein
MRQTLRNIAGKSRRSEFFWRYGFNLAPSLGYRFGAARQTDEFTHGIVSELDKNGIAVASIEDAPGLRTIFSELDLETGKMLETRCEEISKLKSEASDETRIGEKTFLVQLLGNRVEFQPESVFARFALEETLLGVAEEYFKMLVKMRYYNVWLTFATQGKPRESQLWHYDREDKYILKIFVYLNDVDQGAGPFCYAPQTHPKGILSDAEPEFFVENGVRRTTDEQMGKIVAPEKWTRATGKKGTIVFADTRGYHKGGESRTSDRLMFTCMFTSQASESARLLQFPSELPAHNLNRRQLSALELSTIK